mmetsp:Transcript_60867/g.199309  ORF Transcript_60867/g.199309 Transcript_60867/m.199309 type:complete len:385 (+) Transcript_60867:283-1437(+)
MRLAPPHMHRVRQGLLGRQHAVWRRGLRGRPGDTRRPRRACGSLALLRGQLDLRDPAVQEGQLLKRQRSFPRAHVDVQKLEDLTRTTLPTKPVAGALQLRETDRTAAVGVHAAEGELHAAEVVFNPLLERCENLGTVGVVLLQADLAGGVRVEVPPHAPDVAIEAHLLAGLLELAPAGVVLVVGVQKRPPSAQRLATTGLQHSGPQLLPGPRVGVRGQILGGRPLVQPLQVLQADDAAAMKVQGRAEHGAPLIREARGRVEATVLRPSERCEGLEECLIHHRLVRLPSSGWPRRHSQLIPRSRTAAKILFCPCLESRQDCAMLCTDFLQPQDAVVVLVQALPQAANVNLQVDAPTISAQLPLVQEETAMRVQALSPSPDAIPVL